MRMRDTRLRIESGEERQLRPTDASRPTISEVEILRFLGETLQAAVCLVKAVAGAAVVENHRDRADTL